MKPQRDIGLDLRGQIARATTVASAAEPLRLVVTRTVPLTRQGEPLGYLDVLLRLSCHGSGQGRGVLVFDWPTGVSSHSAIQMLERWNDRCGESATCKFGVLQLERRDAASGEVGSGDVHGVHLKVKFPLSEIPDALQELLDLAARAGLASAVHAEIERRQESRQEPGKEVGNAPRGHLRNGVPAAPKEGAGTPLQTTTPGQNRVKVEGQDQAKIERIVHNAVFDPKMHPHVNPNEEVCKSDGTTFRLVMKRMGGVPTRTWIHVRNGTARSSRR